MYAAKRGDEVIGVPEQRNGERAIGRISLLADVADALVANEFFLEYQPQISLVSGRVIGVEALVRWRHPVAGVLYPSEFIGLAEQTELIGDITEQVLRLALNQCATWRRQGHNLSMAVNISARNLQDLHFPQRVHDLLVESGVEPSDIDLEITENTVGVDSSTLHWIFTKLRATGVSISIDDFGTGYSSMAQLRELPVDRIKIDRSFVTNMARQSRDAPIVGAIVQLGLALGIQTIAEGVEDSDVAEMLLTLGCNGAQGSLYGKPLCDILSRVLDDALARHHCTTCPGGEPSVILVFAVAVAALSVPLFGGSLGKLATSGQGRLGHCSRSCPPSRHNLGHPQADARLARPDAGIGGLRAGRGVPGHEQARTLALAGGPGRAFQPGGHRCQRRGNARFAGGLTGGGRARHPGQFMNSTVLSHPHLAWLGDNFSVPRTLPLANVFSVGDVLLAVGACSSSTRSAAQRRRVHAANRHRAEDRGSIAQG